MALSLGIGVHHSTIMPARAASQIEATSCALLQQRTLSGHQVWKICAANGLPITPWSVPPIEELSTQLLALDFDDLSRGQDAQACEESRAFRALPAI